MFSMELVVPFDVYKCNMYNIEDIVDRRFMAREFLSVDRFWCIQLSNRSSIADEDCRNR